MADRRPPDPTPASTGSAGPTKRSCMLCNKKKVRCDKQAPCGYCVRVGVECVVPSARKVPRRVNRAKTADLVARIRELEEEVLRLRGGRGDGYGGGEMGDEGEEEDGAGDGAGHPETGVGGLEGRFGRLVIDQGRSRYVSDQALVSLGDKIEELQDILDPLSSGDESESESSPANTQGLLFPHTFMADTLRSYHPPCHKVRVLWNAYKENVAPIVNMLHKPTVMALLSRASTDADALDKPDEALVFSVYFAAVVSMPKEQRAQELGLEHQEAVQYYRVAAEKALARADMFESQSLTVLQAVVLYIICLRRQDDSKYVWAMSAMVIRLAQGLGVHRDGSNFGLRPFETEMRRRLWWHISFLDLLSAEDHGTDMQFRDGSYDTHLPLNINDDDLLPESDAFPKERVGFTDMTQCLIHSEIIVAMRGMNFTRSSPQSPDLITSVKENEDTIDQLSKDLDDRYLKHCDLNDPRQWVAATTARLALARSWLVIHFPTLPLDKNSRHQETSNNLLQTATQILEFACLLAGSEKTTKWHWVIKSYMQWHALAYLLSELCWRPVNAETDRAWIAASDTFRQWEHDATTTRAPLWRPLSRLMKRAALFKERQGGEGMHGVNHFEDLRVLSTGGVSGEPESLMEDVSVLDTPLHEVLRELLPGVD